MKLINYGIKLSVLLATVAIASVINTAAYAQQAPPIFGDIEIGDKFEPDPMRVRGMSGGSIPGEEITGTKDTPTGPCTGFFDELPDHILKLNTDFEYLKLVAQSSSDITVIIKGPGGTWCNDDFEGSNPGIVGKWLRGEYKVWFGSFRKDNTVPYFMDITQTEK